MDSYSNNEIQKDSKNYLNLEITNLYKRLLTYVGQIENAEINSFIPNSELSEEAFTILCETFDLSDFESKIVLLCAATQIYKEFALLCSMSQKDNRKIHPTLGLILNILDEVDPIAFAPEKKLCYWRLLEIHNNFDLQNSMLKINQHILYYLLGHNNFDKQSLAWIIPTNTQPYPIGTHQELAQKIVKYLEHQPNLIPFLFGTDISSQKNVACLIADSQESDIVKIETRGLPSNAVELHDIAISLLRDAYLLDCLYFIVYDATINENTHFHTIMQLAQRLQPRCILLGYESLKYNDMPIYNIQVNKPLPAEQKSLWQTFLKNSEDYPLNDLITHYDFGINEISEICSKQTAKQALAADNNYTPNSLWQTCRQHLHKGLQGLAQRVECKATWQDIILPDVQLQSLKEITLQVKQRYKVYHEWGFAEKSSRGLGISVLFSGISGTGKTLAAEVIAKELQVDLYSIDLSTIISKYIGETEKNLEKIFQIAEGSGAILLFDEADSIFGKRSEVKDSRDRYANMEVSYLLQRIEAYRGLSILTTNLKNAIDQAFVRRLRFIVNFPFPNQAQREDIWRCVFPTETPLSDVDFCKLSQLNISGGNIRSIALNAAFAAADESESVSMHHLLRAVQNEYLKLGKTLSELANF